MFKKDSIDRCLHIDINSHTVVDRYAQNLVSIHCATNHQLVQSSDGNLKIARWKFSVILYVNTTDCARHSINTHRSVSNNWHSFVKKRFFSVVYFERDSEIRNIVQQESHSQCAEMASLINVRLNRGDATPWGFRLQGGKDFGTPLVIQKVSDALGQIKYLLKSILIFEFFICGVL